MSENPFCGRSFPWGNCRKLKAHAGACKPTHMLQPPLEFGETRTQPEPQSGYCHRCREHKSERGGECPTPPKCSGNFCSSEVFYVCSCAECRQHRAKVIKFYSCVGCRAQANRRHVLTYGLEAQWRIDL